MPKLLRRESPQKPPEQPLAVDYASIEPWLKKRIERYVTAMTAGEVDR